MKNEQILKLKVEDDLTIKEYLENLLLKLWKEQECFSGKRPFGNSGWEYDLYVPLIKNGICKGTLDEYDCIEDCNDIECYNKIKELIEYIFE